MSFEGYYRILCKNGHLSSCDCYEDPVFSKNECSEGQSEWTCYCGEVAAWWQLIDVTNGSYCPAWNTEAKRCDDVAPEGYDGEYSHCGAEQLERCKQSEGRIDGFFELEISSEEEHSVCKHCGCSKLLKNKTYKIPEDRGHKVNQ